MMLQWLWKKTGPLSIMEVDAGGFVRSHPDVAHPDIQFSFIPGTFKEGGRSIPLYHAFQVTMIYFFFQFT